MTSPDAPLRLFGSRFRWVSLGMIALSFLEAFENLGVTTVMPVISRELDGAALYAVAFAGPLAIGVVGMVLAGTWSDRAGPRWPLYVSVALFAAGLVIAGTATTMVMIVVGRLVYGLAAGATSVALYVIVARIYPEELRPRIFGGFAAAWVIPALVGPAIAGILSDTIGWRWVFLSVAILALPALAITVPAIQGADVGRGDVVHGATAPVSLRRIGCAVLLAAAVLGIGLSDRVPGAISIAVALVALAVAVAAARPLLPPGTLRSLRGLPTVISLRAVTSGAYFAAEVYLPYLLTTRYGLSPALAGLALTAGGVAWGIASLVQGRAGNPLGTLAAVRGGIAGVALGVGMVLVTSLLGLPAWVAIVGWAIGGAGMGTTTPRLSVTLLALSTPDAQGFNSSAVSIADTVGAGIALAIAGLLFGAVATAASFSVVFAFALVLGIAAVVLTRRLQPSDRPL